jgi:hypothetical protein
MKISSPSIFLKLLQWAVQSGSIKRGYGRLLKYLPFGLWGGRNVRIETGVGNMVLPLDDPASGGLLFFGEISHEKAESSLVRRLAETSRAVIDIGAHFGWYSLLMAGAMEKNGHVYAFEPNPHTFQFLQENTKSRANISAFPLAVSDSEKTVTFYCAETSSLSSAVRSVGQP